MDGIGLMRWMWEFNGLRYILNELRIKNLETSGGVLTKLCLWLSPWVSDSSISLLICHFAHVWIAFTLCDFLNDFLQVFVVFCSKYLQLWVILWVFTSLVNFYSNEHCTFWNNSPKLSIWLPRYSLQYRF